MQIRVVIFLVCALFSGTIEAQLYSFEQEIPSHWSVSSGSISTTTDRYKLGNQSLCWSWNAASVITLNQPNGLASASTNKNGGVSCWIYNENPSERPLLFSFYSSDNREICHQTFGLNYKGWRMMMAEFKADMGHNSSPLVRLSIHAPSTGSGKIYLDHFEFLDQVFWERMSDHQITVAQSLSNTDDFRGAYAKQLPATKPTQQELQAIEQIATRVDEWLLWRSAEYSNDPYFLKRKSAIDNWIIQAQKTCDKYGLKRLSDSEVQGAGLYPMRLSSPATDGTHFMNFRTVSESCLIPLAIDYLKNGNLKSKRSVIDILDWFYDQGWAAGSSLGTIRFEKLRSAGYFHAAYLMRHELGDERLSRICDQMRWFSLSGYTIVPYMNDEESADNLRTLIQAKLYYALMVEDKSKSVALLKALAGYLNHSFAPSSGYLGTIKPDYSGYHHRGTYFGAYYPQALYAVSLVNYWMQNTPFALDSNTQTHLKNALLKFADVAATYDIPTACSGRFPYNTTIMDLLLPAYGYTYLSLGGDEALGAVIRRLWRPSQEPLMSRIAKANTEITHCMTMGEIALMLKAYESAAELREEPNKASSCFLPYSGLLIKHTDDHHVSVKGFSKYIWDYESSSTENLWGRYLSYGQIEYTDKRSSKKNNNYIHPSWNWNRIPGTTTKVVSSQELNYLEGGASRDRNFSDSPFLGGLAINDSTALFSMMLHDNTFDKSLYANKSLFIKGNTILCLGSGINCQPSSSAIITTLIQQQLEQNETITINGSALSSASATFQNPIIRDNLGIGYIVKQGSVTTSKTGTLASAYINHGNNPTNDTYQYYMIIDAPESLLAQYGAENQTPFEVIQCDNTAHIIRVKADQSENLAIYNHTATLKSSKIRSVNSPSIVSLLPKSDGCELLVSDPDMRRGSAANMGKLSIDQIKMASQPFMYEITLNGIYYLSGDQPLITTEHRGATTLIRLTVVDGKQYRMTLKEQPSAIERGKAEETFSYLYNANNHQCTINATDSRPFNCYIWNSSGQQQSSYSQITAPYNIDLSPWQNSICFLEIESDDYQANYKIFAY